METVFAALISAGAAIVVCIINSRVQARELTHQLELQQAVTNTKIDELTREVREHNGFARRLPVLEEQMRVANHRIDDLEKGDDRR